MRLPGQLTLDQLSQVEGLVHGFLSRQGGVSPEPYLSLNLSPATGDSLENVRANMDLVRQGLGFQKLVTVHQVHGAGVVAVDGRLPADQTTPLAKSDGLVTDRPGLGLLLKVADCLGVIVLVHAGWRGLAAGALPAGVRAMVRRFGGQAQDLMAGIGPSLGPCCAEFKNYRLEFPKEFWKYNIGRDHFDLWAIARDQLVAAGLDRANIQTVGLCTRCRPDLFFSHRGQGPVTGRLGVVAGYLV
ncbi:MAG: laccase domain-containing protein [Deltaproteobacteria bacterium]|nr:laccase domain-containing protein [Deltaproteobacteria bacterium]